MKEPTGERFACRESDGFNPCKHLTRAGAPLGEAAGPRVSPTIGTVVHSFVAPASKICAADASGVLSIFQISIFMPRAYESHMDIRCPCENIFSTLKITLHPQNLP